MDNFDRKNITLKRISGRRVFLFASTAAALVADIAVIILLAVAGITEAGYLACPIVLLIADVAFLLFAIFSNFRFKYSLFGTVVFASIETVALAVMLFTHLGDPRAVSTLAGLHWLGLHVLVVVATILLALGAANYNKALKRAAVAPAAVVVACAVGYGVVVAMGGVFGQGYIGGRRTLTYRLDDEGEGYIVNGYVDGRGDTVVIPDSFDGKPITGIDCAVLAEKGINTVSFECTAVPKLYNVAALSDFKLGTVGIGKADIDAVRSAYFMQAYEYIDGNYETENVDGVVRLAQAFFPNDLASDEKYVTFDYSADNYSALKRVRGEVLPVWIGKNNQSFSVADYDVEYAKHAKSDSDEDLHWSYNNLDGRILSVTYGGKPLNSTPSGVSVHGAIVSFDKIYKVTVAEDNDSVYETDAKFTTCAYGSFIYAVESNADKRVLDVIPSRAGFDLDWEYELPGSNDFRTKFTSLERVVSSIDGDSVTIHPVWKLLSPVITSLSTNKSNNTVTYGDPVSVTAVASAPAEGFDLAYEWDVPAYVVFDADGEAINIDRMRIDGGGAYSVKITASNPEVTSLTSESTRSVNVLVAKRPIGFTWSELTDDVYDATEKPISCDYDETAVVGSDTITYNLSADTVRDRGTYAVSVTLSGDAATKYTVSSGAIKNYVVKPCEIDVSWDYTSPYVYGGVSYIPTASALPLITTNTPAYDRLNITVSGAGFNAGTYTAQVNLGNSNYVARGNSGTCVFVIEKRPITPVWNTDTFTYTGRAQCPAVTSVTGAVTGEDESVLTTISYGGAGINATPAGETYTATATLPQSGNYKFVGDAPATQQFVINKKAINAVAASKTVTYSGRAFTAFDCTATGLVNGESIKNSNVATLSYSLTGGEGINVGTYTINLSVESANYEVTTATGVLTIDPAVLNFIISTVSETYAGTVYDGTTFRHSVVGLQNGETEADVFGTVTYSFKRVSETTAQSSVKNCGTYDVTADFSNKDGQSYKNYTVSVASGQLFITKAPLTIRADNKSKVYDGQALTAAELTYTSQGFIDGESVDDLDGFSISCAEVDKGTHAIVVTAAGATNYDLTCINGSLTISAKPITVTATTTAPNNTKVYDGLPVGYSYSAPGLVAGDTLDVELTVVKGLIPEYDGNPVNMAVHMGDIVDAGTYTIEPSVTHKNYIITIQNAVLTIEKKQLTLTASGNEKTYDGYSFSESDVSYTVGGNVVLNESAEGYHGSLYSVDMTNVYDFIDVGTLTVTVTASGQNYVAASTAVTLKIDRKPITVAVVTTEPNNTKVYDGQPFAYSYSGNGLLSRDTLSVTYTVTKNGTAFTGNIVDVGEYVVTPVVTHNNYDITLTAATLTVTKAPLTITAENKTKVYGAADPAFTCTATGLVNGDTLANVTTVSYACSGVNVGSHDITVSATEATNYDITCNKGTLTITKAPLTITAENKSKVYGAADPAFTCTATGLVNGDTLANVTTVSYACSGVNVGSHDITVSATDATNYDITCNKGTLTITKATLTITASNKTKVYDGAQFGASAVYSVTGVDNGFTVTASPALDACVDVGSYDVTITATGANYNTATATVTLTVTEKSVAVTWTGVREYAEGEQIAISASTDDPLTLSLEYYNGDVKLDGAPTAEGDYTVKAVCDNGNYVLTNSEQSFKIIAADDNDPATGGGEEENNEVR